MHTLYLLYNLKYIQPTSCDLLILLLRNILLFCDNDTESFFIENPIIVREISNHKKIIKM